MDNSFDHLTSPSKAAQAASDYEAWSSVFDFLKPLFHPRPIPSFERNPDTLKALLDLISYSESLTEQATSTASTHSQILQAVESSASQSKDPVTYLLTTLERSLTLEGSKALDTLASLSTTLGTTSADPDEMAMSVVQLKRSECEVEQQLQRVETLHQQLKAENARAEELLARLKGEESQTPRNIPHKTGEWTRGARQLDMKLGEYKGRAKRLEKGHGGRKAVEIGIPELKAEEREIRDLEARVSGLEGRVRGFEGLPPDKELALLEVEKMRKELEALARRRDAMFEGLVEGEK